MDFCVLSGSKKWSFSTNGQRPFELCKGALRRCFKPFILFLSLAEVQEYVNLLGPMYRCDLYVGMVGRQKTAFVKEMLSFFCSFIQPFGGFLLHD